MGAQDQDTKPRKFRAVSVRTLGIITMLVVAALGAALVLAVIFLVSFFNGLSSM